MAARFFSRRTRKEASTPAQWEEPILKHTFEGHNDGIQDMIEYFVFLHDNVHIVTGCWDGTMRKWNCNTGLIVGEPWKAEDRNRLSAMALSPDGKTIACGGLNGGVQRWNTDGEMIAGVWTGHRDFSQVGSLSWSPSGDHIASGSDDGTIIIRKTKSGRVVVGPIKTKQNGVRALAYSPSGNRIASGGYYGTICIWNTKGKRVVGPINGLGLPVTSLVWSSDSTKLYSASDTFARVFNSKSGELLHRFKHDHVLNSVTLSPKHNVLACAGSGIARLWDTESLEPLGPPFIDNQDEKHLVHRVSFSPDGHHLAYGGRYKVTLWSVKDIAPQLAAPILPQQSDRQSIQQETQPNSPSSSCLDADATGGDGIIEEGNDDPYNNFFQTSHQSLPPASSHLRRLFSAPHFLKVFSRHHPLADESVPKERSKRKFFARRARSHSSLELATMKHNHQVLEGKVGEGKGEQGDNDVGSSNDPLSARKNKAKQQHDPPADAQSPPSRHPTPPADLDSKYNRNLWEWLMQARGKNTISGSLDFSTRPTNVPQAKPCRPWAWNSNFPVGSSRRPVDVAAWRDEDRYGIVPESDAEAAAAMLRTSGNEVDRPTRPGQPVVGAQVAHGQTQTQASTSATEDRVYEVSCYGFFCGYRRRSNLRAR